MGNISVVRSDITLLRTDAIVNAANNHLSAGGGVCGAIFSAAGYSELKAACDEIGFCNTGSAVVTPAFSLNAKYIVHAVGPIWRGGDQDEEKLLYSTYYSSLTAAAEKGCRSIAFPLVSAGIYGYPSEDAWRIALTACRDFTEKNDMDISFAVLSEEQFDMGNAILSELLPHKGSGTQTASEMDRLRMGNTETDAIFFYKVGDEYGAFSNWAPSEFTVDGVKFNTSEQYIMYRKCLTFGDTVTAEKLLNSDSPKDQKALGREASGYIDSVWAGVRQTVAIRGLYAKFSQNPELKRLLLSTEDAVLVECTSNDHIWACGLDKDDDDRLSADRWKGQNLLGFALMEVRNMLRAEG
ncbi:NADAR domain-containing protein [Ruminococcus flavefaciens]|uniref:NADAR domain-containing protein n=1 Tax=Ruminococcus flavefaciens TaxID=1265 RepID=UPI000A7106D8|nr:NADAR domain-containing protein [Ruminococcus flavefaciens]